MLKHHFPNASDLIYGCMGLGGSWDDAALTRDDKVHAQGAVEAALDAGITVFDHADIYTLGKAESVFGQLLTDQPHLRDKMILQSKCAIRFADAKGPKRYDFSAEWITQSVEGSLRRLNTEQLDILLLHRPDPLIALDEVAQTLATLITTGKIKHIGVSNMNRFQMEYLQSALNTPIVANQLELSLAARGFVEEAISVNTPDYGQAGFTAGTVEYCQMHNVQLQAWGALAQGRFSGGRTQGATDEATARLVSELAEKYHVAPEAIVLGWLTRHPARIQPVIGTTNPERIHACAQAATLSLSREDWYLLFETVRGQDVP
ncbi:aldo/keto reductase [Salinimonas sp. HHU 13199]|uniref:Aldo/keto reductase n=1 Tax=Salinimonas profundi TaxID=2729140 RepID=A0ABR8LPJ6_9ALTE|nr:aldo/keto reductase [Salinimonas profundi]MBD3586332.1 aldo/keto reductase [Salinimonas profundi]